jgi:hypothetical protein
VVIALLHIRAGGKGIFEQTVLTGLMLIFAEGKRFPSIDLA